MICTAGHVLLGFFASVSMSLSVDIFLFLPLALLVIGISASFSMLLSVIAIVSVLLLLPFSHAFFSHPSLHMLSIIKLSFTDARVKEESEELWDSF